MFEFASTLESRLSGDAGLYRLRSERKELRK